MDEAGKVTIGAAQLAAWNKTLNEYKAAKASLDRRIIASEQWWKIRNAREEEKEGSRSLTPGRFKSQSGWLHNVIVSKHADAMDAYPEPNILPREQGDSLEAQMLSSVIPAVIEQNDFESTYSDATWQKLKTGTGAYKIMWDAKKLNGLGDIAIEKVNILNLFWTPGITDIQDSRMVFHTAAVDMEELAAQYPHAEGQLRNSPVTPARFLTDDPVPQKDKVTVVEVYYHKTAGGRKVLHYCKYAGDTVLYATENETQPPTVIETLEDGTAVERPVGRPMSETGLYDHGMFPFVLDTLFPVEGSPCGYGFVDLCKNPQTEIDLMKTAMLKNAMVGATPRYFAREDGEINEEELIDLNKPIVHVSGALGRDSLVPIGHSSLDGNYVTHLMNTVQELRETSGNTETAAGSVSSGVTAASAIAALQEASGKGSRDSTRSSYRAYAKIIYMVIELIRQFYDLPRQFRIMGLYGTEQFINYSNAGLRPQYLDDSTYRLPVFDIRVTAQKRSAYTKMAQNELAIQFFQMGFFDPRMSDQALMCIDMMEFDGKDAIQQKIARGSSLYRQLIAWQQLGLKLARDYAPQMVPGLAGSVTGIPAPKSADLGRYRTLVSGREREEPARMRAARLTASSASQPDGGKVIASR